MRSWMLLLTAAMCPAVAMGQVVNECDRVGEARSIVEPWEDHSRTYANGVIRVAAIDTGGEPVCCSSHLMVLSPSGNGEDGPVYRQCRIVSQTENFGFYAVDVGGIDARYDPARGLTLDVPVATWHTGMENGADPHWSRMSVTINQSNGDVSAE